MGAGIGIVNGATGNLIHNNIVASGADFIHKVGRWFGGMVKFGGARNASFAAASLTNLRTTANLLAGGTTKVTSLRAVVLNVIVAFIEARSGFAINGAFGLS